MDRKMLTSYTNQSSPSWESQLTDSLLGDPSLSGVGEKCETRTPSSSPSHPLNGLAPLKVHLHEIFDFCFFSSKAPTWSPDSYPKFVSNIKSNSPRYSNYSSLCVDSFNTELIFCFKLYKNC
jgi:hypothetical protein